MTSNNNNNNNNNNSNPHGVTATVAVPMATAIPIHDSNDKASSSSTTTTTPMIMSSSSAYNDNPTLTDNQVSNLQAQGYPTGLAKQVGQTRAAYPCRFWVVDNSGSMQTADGHEIRSNHDYSHVQVTPCTRWVELQGALRYHIELAGLLEVTTMFRLLNDPGQAVGPQTLVVGDASGTTSSCCNSNSSSSILEQVQQACHVIQRATPRGVTPLTRHLQDIYGHISAQQEWLRQRGQEAVVVLATDGLPSNPYGESSEAVLREFLLALKSIQSLPVWIVIRLCTDDEKVVHYYNNLDKELELPLEVIDDYFGEAEEIYEANRWLNYGLPLHRCREMGYHHRIFDLLDERLLNKDELLEFVQLLFGVTHPWPDPHAQWKEFLQEIQAVMQVETKQFNPKTHKMDPWIDVRQLKKLYGAGGGGGGFRLFKKKK